MLGELSANTLMPEISHEVLHLTVPSASCIIADATQSSPACVPRLRAAQDGATEGQVELALTAFIQHVDRLPEEEPECGADARVLLLQM